MKRIREQVRETARAAGAAAVAVAVHDLATGRAIRLDADRWFHAASTIKLAVLVALYHAIEHGRLQANARVHVRNRFTSLADGRHFRVQPDRDANEAVHGYIGRTMRVLDLARHMIVTSSNLATNVLVELVGPAAIRGTLDGLGVDGIEFLRGVEDEAAWAAGINNRVTADGLASLLRLIAEESAVSPEASRGMLEILYDQRFADGIPAGLPEGSRVANKTGEISTVAHDAGIVYLPGREPYVLVVLTEWSENGDARARRGLIADVSRLVSGHLAPVAHG